MIRKLMVMALMVTALAGCHRHAIHDAPANFPTLAEARAGFPVGVDVYTVVGEMNRLKQEGRIDNFRCWVGGEYFEGWKSTANPPETWVITVDLRPDGVVKDVKIETWKTFADPIVP